MNCGAFSFIERKDDEEVSIQEASLFFADCAFFFGTVHRSVALPTMRKYADPEVYKDGRKQKYKDAVSLRQIVAVPAASWDMVLVDGTHFSVKTA